MSERSQRTPWTHDFRSTKHKPRKGTVMHSSNPSSKRRFAGKDRLGVHLAALLVGWFGIASHALADGSMRCGVHLVSKGALQEEVLAKCGQPYSASGTYWLYRQGQTVYRVQFNAVGEVRRIKAEIRF